MTTDRVGTCFCGGPLIVPHNMVHNTPYCEKCGEMTPTTFMRAMYEESRRLMEAERGEKNDDWGV